jgi:hypothetical protein
MIIRFFILHVTRKPLNSKKYIENFLTERILKHALETIHVNILSYTKI